MNATLARILYNALLPVGALAGHAAAWGNPKMRDAIAGRRGFRSRWRVARDQLGGARPVWFHVASVGEFEQARPVISAIARRAPEVPVVLTFSSPSGYRFVHRKEAIGVGETIRFVDYLPFDSIANARFCLDCIDPRLVVFVKFDLWPNLIWECQRRRTPAVLIDATLSPSSRRNSRAGRSFYRSVYAAFQRILAISDADAARFRATVPGFADISVTGDTRFDRVMERWEQRSPLGFDFGPGDGPVVIAGSTWPADEAHLLGALATLLDNRNGLRVVIAPHEPTAEHVEPLRGWASEIGHPAAVVSPGSPGDDARVVIVDTVGVLAEAYRLASVAYVGGSFSTGVHSVIEPAIAGLPVVFGPVHDNSHEALELLSRGAAFAGSSEAEIHSHLQRLVSDPEARRTAGEAGRRYVDSQLGATEKCMAAIEPFL